MKMGVGLVLMVSVVGMPSVGFAQQGPLAQRVTKLERKTKRQARKIKDLNLRIAAIEDLVDGGGGGGRLPDAHLGVSCAVKDSYNGKMHIGVANSQLDAEYAAFQACDAKLHMSYCSGKVQCEAITSSSKMLCLLKDTYNGKRYRGEGDNEQLAKASAVESCDKSLHISYCVGGEFKCEAAY